MAAEPEDVLVDVGIPVYRPTFLAEAIESVLAQTLARWRLLISDDSPGDGSEVRAAIEPYLGDPRIRYEATGGVGGPRNMWRIVERARAPYVALLHDDDRWFPTYLDRRTAFLERHPTCGFAFSGAVEIDERGRELRRHAPPLPERLYPRAEFLVHLARHNIVGTPTLLVRRAAYESVGPFSVRFPMMADYEMWTRIALRWDVGCLAAEDAAYRRHSDQMTYSERYGAELLPLVEHLDGLLAQGDLDTSRARAELAARRPGLRLSAALDAVQRGERARSLRLLGSAVRGRPSLGLDARVPLALAGLATGRRGQSAVERARGAVHRRGGRPRLARRRR